MRIQFLVSYIVHWLDRITNMCTYLFAVFCEPQHKHQGPRGCSQHWCLPIIWANSARTCPCVAHIIWIWIIWTVSQKVGHSQNWRTISCSCLIILIHLYVAAANLSQNNTKSALFFAKKRKIYSKQTRKLVLFTWQPKINLPKKSYFLLFGMLLLGHKL